MTTDATRYRQAVELQGLSRTHHQIIDWLPRGGSVLELGCASGYHGRLFMERKGCKVVGVEVDEAAAAEARRLGLDVRVGSLEEASFRDSIEGPFDAVVAGDVIEHLRDPLPVLRHMRRWLRPDGRAIVAVPNIATWGMRKQLFFGGAFDYQETGILDRTHLRFFTWHSLLREVDAAGFRVVDSMFEIDHVAWKSLLTRVALGPFKARVMERLTDRFPNLFAEHLALLLSPKP